MAEEACEAIRPPIDALRRELVDSGQPYRDLGGTILNGEQTWTMDEMLAEFDVLGFAAPFVVVRRKSDGQRGSLEFTHSPRVYFGWSEAQ